jgi:hypothetical protein
MQSLHEYQGFPVNLNDIASLLFLLGVDKQSLLKKTGFGDNKIRSLLDYLKDFGLVIESKKYLSELGNILKEEDKNLSEDFSKWLCVYNWAKVNNNPALYFLLNFAHSGQDINTIEEDFKDWAFENSIQTDYKKDFASKLLALSRRALTESDAFQDLTLIAMQHGQMYRTPPYNVHTLLVGYVLYDNSKGRRSVSIPQLIDEPGNVGRFFSYGEQTLNKRLDELENIGLVQRVQNANLNMVQLSYEGQPIDFVKQYYAEN